MGKTAGVPDGTGPARRSAQRKTSNVGKKQQAGKKCPMKKK